MANSKWLSAEQLDRWRILRDLTAGDDWWQDVLGNKAFIAGGAAAFVGDRCQCVDTVGDVDIWAPVSIAEIKRWVVALVELLEFRGVEYRIALGSESSIIVATSCIDFQFIRLREDQEPEPFIKRFDFTYVQAALCGWRTGFLAAPEMLVTREALQAWENRTLVMSSNGRHFWVKSIENDSVERLLLRAEKAFRKGFATRARPPPTPHQCSCAHRTVRATEQRHNDNWRDLFDELILFDEDNYTRPQSGGATMSGAFKRRK